jgi:hypothetical protein
MRGGIKVIAELADFGNAPYASRATHAEAESDKIS